VVAYNLGNFMRTLAMPKAAEPWSLTSLREKLIKIGAKVVSHGRYVTFQIPEVAVSRQMFQEILSLIARLRAPPAPARGALRVRCDRENGGGTLGEVRPHEQRHISMLAGDGRIIRREERLPRLFVDLLLEGVVTPHRSRPPADRGELLSWLFYIGTGLGPFSGQALHFQLRAPEKLPYAINRYRREAERHYAGARRAS
jgi:hypothetical protein